MTRNLWIIAAILALAVSSAQGAFDIIVDNDDGAPGYTETGAEPWRLSTSTGWGGGTYLFKQDYDPPGTATWRPVIPETGPVEILALIRTSTNRTSAAVYTIEHANGVTDVTISQNGPNTIAELPIAQFTFNAGSSGSVSLSNGPAPGAHIADAIRFRSATDDPPQVTSMSHDPAYPDEGEAVVVTAWVSDDATVSEVTLHYSAAPSGASAALAMSGTGPWTATIPGFTDGESVTYYVEARDSADQNTTSNPAVYVVGESAPREYRVIWADSWNSSFLNASQAQDFVNTCRQNNINTIMPEIRKIGDAYYDSNLEPRATNISGGASFDPLQYLIDLCHDTSGGKQYLHVHAWFVMHRISRGETLSPLHVLSQHPEYEMLDSNGSIGASNRYLDPGHPGTIEHNVAVILDCMANYDIDGVNLDYIRYPESAGSWGYNPVSVARFNAFMNRTGQPSSGDPAWAAWRRRCVTQEVRNLYVNMKKLKPHVVLNADTVNWGFSWNNWTSSSAYAGVYQDWVGWLEEGILDYNALMNYSNENQYPGRFEGWTDLSLASDDIRGSIIGIGAYLQDEVADSMWQLLYAREQGAAGLNIYDWGSEVNGDDFGTNRTQFYEALRNEVFTEPVDPPGSPWLDNPTKGIVEGTVTCGGEPVDHATVAIAGGRSVYTDGTGWFGLVETEPGLRTLAITAPGEPVVTVSAVVSAGEVVTVNADCAQVMTTGDVWGLE